MTKNKLITLFTIAIIFLFSHIQTVTASTSLSIDPPIVRIQVKPGKAITKAFTIQNRSDQEKQLIVRLAPFSESDKFGNPIVDLKNTSPLQKYFSLSNTDIKFNEPFTIKPDNSQQIVLSLSIPETADLEDSYFNLLVSTYDNSLPSQSPNTSVSSTIGANLLISVTSELNPKTILKINNIQITSKNYLKLGKYIIVDSLSPLTFQISATNNGQFITETKGTISISKGIETTSIQGILPQYIIKKSTRQLLNLEGNTQFSFTPNPLTIGWYQINTHIKSDNTNSNNSTDIFILPGKLILALILAIVIIRLITKSRRTIDSDIS